MSIPELCNGVIDVIRLFFQLRGWKFERPRFIGVNCILLIKVIYSMVYNERLPLICLGKWQLVCMCADHSIPERNTDHQRFVVYHKPILDLSLPFLVVYPGSLRELEPPQQPAEQHPHLHQRQVLPCADRGTIRERDKSSCVVFAPVRALAEPPSR